MSADEAERLRQLEERIATLKQAQEPAPREESHLSKAHIGWRMVSELVIGLMIGFSIGYGIDVLTGTMPIFTVLFLFAGFAAGIKAMIHTARELQGEAEADPGNDPDIGPAEQKKEG